MEDIKCTKLIAIYREKNYFLSETKPITFRANDNAIVSIEQSGRRIITVTFENEGSFIQLYNVLTEVERLLNLFDGRFFTLTELNFETINEKDIGHMKSYANNLKLNRLSYYNSADFCYYPLNKLLDFEIITSDLFKKWQTLEEELDIAYQLYLYSVSNNELPVDTRSAFLIELSEPIIEIVKKHTHFYSSLNPGERGSSLKTCIDSLISKYGKEIFKKELNGNFEKFLQVLVNSRVRIMHIKRHQCKSFLDGNESLLYINKLSLLYRIILFEILGIDSEFYKNRLKDAITSWNEWNGIQDNFLIKIN